MPDVLLFGATGYTGRLTAHALARRGVDFAIAGRSRDKLERLAEATGSPDVRVASVGDIDALAHSLEDVKVLVTCVGPFVELGSTAVEAALRAGVHYIDSTGEGPFIADLIENKSEQARAAGIAMAPAMGFDEVPADSAASLATEGMSDADLTLTYGLPSHASTGTLRTLLTLAGTRGAWLVNGRRVSVRLGQHQRWAPMPPPLGPRASISFPFAEGHLAPLHLDLANLRTFGTAGPIQRVALRFGSPALPLLGLPLTKAVADKVLDQLPDGPDESQRRRSYWTLLAEARSGKRWRNVALSGTDPYGLTAEFLSAAAVKIATEGPLETGVVAPVQAVGLDTFEKEFVDCGVNVETFEAH